MREEDEDEGDGDRDREQDEAREDGRELECRCEEKRD